VFGIQEEIGELIVGPITPMLLWEDVKAEFVWEGSWRGICVPEVSASEWRAALDALRAADFEQQYTVNTLSTAHEQS
jgi:hypothetical protein